MDLHAPLGRKPPPPKRRTWWVAAVLIVVATLVGAGVYLFHADPRGGEPYAVAEIPPAPTPKSTPPGNVQGATDPTPTGSIGNPKPSTADSVRFEHGVKIVSPSDAVPPKARDEGPLVIDVSKALDADARKVAAIGHSKGPTAPPRTALSGGTRPRIAIFVSGLGLSDKATRTAIEIMPAAITLAFVPYGDSLSTMVGMAKAKGHEILLQLPMQNTKGPPPGPHTLSSDVPAAQTANDLNWLMTHLDSYVGVTNLLGAPVTAQAATLTTILKGVHEHGVFYVDDGTSKRSLAMSLAPGLGVPAVQADVVLDATSDPTVVTANLDKLVALARKKGSAIGVANSLSDHLATVARFATDLDSRGFALVPVSTLAQASMNTATMR